jgi:lipopolysaccharide biosynthesis glycosyltransferase
LFEKQGELLAVKNYDSPFSAAAKHVQNDTLFNSGLMVLRPSKDTFREMMSQLPTFESYNGGDQGFLNSFFSAEWTELPVIYNLNKMMFKYSRTELVPMSDIKVIHYVRKKPWYPYSQQFEKKKNLYDTPLDFSPLNDYWHRVFDSLKRRVLVNLELDVLETHDHCIELFSHKEAVFCLNVFPEYCPPGQETLCELRTRQGPMLIGRNEDISIVTQLSEDKMFRLIDMCNEWDGPISAALFIETDLDEALQRVEAVSHLLPWDRLALHLVHQDAQSYHYKNMTLFKPASPLYPINMLRNTATRFATTDLVIILDIDFQITPELYHQFDQPDLRRFDEYAHVFQNSHLNHVFVIPAFEFNYSKVACMEGEERSELYTEASSLLQDMQSNDAENAQEETTAPQLIDDARICSRLPRSKRELSRRVANHEIMIFHPETLSHTPTRYDTYLNTSRPYYVYWETYYEPYLLLRKSTLPLLPAFDERFVDRSRNKAVFAFELYVRGFRFVVLPDAFVIHYYESKTMQDATRRPPMRAHSVLYRKIVESQRRLFNCTETEIHCPGSAPLSPLYNEDTT